VIGSARKLSQLLRQFWVLIALSLALLAITGTGLSIAGWQIWAWHHYRLAEQAVEQRDFALARAELACCLRVWPNSAEVHLLAARTARRATSYDDAEQHLKECQRLGWPVEEIGLERDLISAQRGEVAGIEDQLVQCAVHDHPNALLILEALCRGYIKTYRFPQALHCLELWLARRPDDVQALLWRAEVEELRSSTPEALADYRRILELDPDRDDAHLKLAKLLAQEQHPAEAVAHFERLRQQQPADPALLLGLARCRRLLGEPAEAAKLLDTLLAISPEDAGALAERGRLCLDAGQYAQAERWLRSAVAQVPYDRDITYALYVCLQQCGKPKEAEVYQAKLREIDSQLDRLRELTRQIGESPHDPALRHEAGMIFLRSGQTKEGLRWLYSALQENPGYRPTHQVLADYYESAGEKPQAAWHRHQAKGN
jgi:tetratricopeptide (TPR) repeat protein